MSFSQYLPHQDEICIGTENFYVYLDAYIDTDEQTRIMVHHRNIDAFVQMLLAAKRSIEDSLT